MKQKSLLLFLILLPFLFSCSGRSGSYKRYGVRLMCPAYGGSSSSATWDFGDGKNSGNGLLTCGEISDFSKWKAWEQLVSTEFNQFSKDWNIPLTNRFTVQVTNNQKIPIEGAIVCLYSSKRKVWQTVTDNTGKAELWAETNSNNLSVSVDSKGMRNEFEEPLQFSSGINFVEFNVPCNPNPFPIEIAIVVDATGSMQDEINFLKADLEDILNKTEESSGRDIKIASVFYRDKSDDYILKKSDFTSNRNDAIRFIKQQTAGGGGDYPEALNEAFDFATNELNWSESITNKLMFIFLDAPPHKGTEEKVKSSLITAAQKGIRIIPVVCSGSDKSLEFLMRSFALATNGTYLFLTDHSGIGNSHTVPSTDSFDVYTMNELITQVIQRFTSHHACEPIIESLQCDSVEKNSISMKEFEYLTREEKSIDHTGIGEELPPSSHMDKPSESGTVDWNWNLFPNPVQTSLTIEFATRISGSIELFDMKGKFLNKFNLEDTDRITFDVSQFSVGTYFISFRNSYIRKVAKIVKA